MSLLKSSKRMIGKDCSCSPPIPHLSDCGSTTDTNMVSMSFWSTRGQSWIEIHGVNTTGAWEAPKRKHPLRCRGGSSSEGSKTKCRKRCNNLRTTNPFLVRKRGRNSRRCREFPVHTQSVLALDTSRGRRQHWQWLTSRLFLGAFCHEGPRR